MSQTASNLVVHMIFSTKARQPLLTPEIRDDVFAYLGGVIREMRGTALIVGGTADHVHMLFRIRPAQAVAEIARVVKTNSSRWLRKKGMAISPGKTATGFFPSAIRKSNPPAIPSRPKRNIIRNFRFRMNSARCCNGTRSRSMSDMSGIDSTLSEFGVSAHVPRVARASQPWAE